MVREEKKEKHLVVIHTLLSVGEIYRNSVWIGDFI